MTEQLSAVAHQLQHLFAERCGIEILQTQHPKELVLLQQGAIEARTHTGTGQIEVVAQHRLMGRFREAQGFAGAQGTDIAAVATNGIDAINTQRKDGRELLAAQIAVGLIVPENEPIGPQTLFKGFEQGGILLLARHLAKARQLQCQLGDRLLTQVLQTDEPEAILLVSEGDVPELAGKAHGDLAAMAVGQQLLDGQAQGIGQLGRPGGARLIEPVERGLHHVGQGDQPLTAQIQTEKERRLEGRRKMTECGRRHEQTTSC